MGISPDEAETQAAAPRLALAFAAPAQDHQWEVAEMNDGKLAAENADNRSMGIRGWISQNIGHLGAMGVVCTVFVWQTREGMLTARDDRAMFREELKAIRVDANDRYIRTEATHTKTMEKMGATIERTVTSMEKATRVLEETANKLPGGGGP